MTGRCHDIALSTLLETADKHYDALQTNYPITGPGPDMKSFPNRKETCY
jgi:hypothetical protein